MDNVSNIAIHNIYYMLTYAFQVLNQSNYDDISVESFENIHDLFAAILSKGIAQQLKQGLHREYVNKIEDMPVMHGKLNMNGTMKNYAQNHKLLTCEFDELSENNIFNQIIKTTVCILMKHSSIKEETRVSLKKEMMFFAYIDEINPFLIRWDQLRFNRNNQNYRMLLNICRFVIEGLLLSTDSGDIKVSQFLDEQRMSRLYEKFILEFYRKEMPWLKANASKIEWQLDEGVSTMLPSMQSDITLTYGDKTLIIDAKYYSHSTQEQFGKHALRSNNIYQIFTYVMNKDIGNTGNVAGLLLYAKTDEEIIPDADNMIMGHKISAKTLDLNCEFKIISEQLVTIAEDYFK